MRTERFQEMAPGLLSADGGRRGGGCPEYDDPMAIKLKEVRSILAGLRLAGYENCAADRYCTAGDARLAAEDERESGRWSMSEPAEDAPGL